MTEKLQAINFGKGASRKKWHTGVFERKRRSSEEVWGEFWWKKGIRGVGLAYRELIGSLYESWTIGIERIYKLLIHTVIRQG